MRGASGAFWICQAFGSLVVDGIVGIRSFGCAGEDMVRNVSGGKLRSEP